MKPAILRMQLLRWFWVAIAAAILFNLGVLPHVFFVPAAMFNSSDITVHTENTLGWLLGTLLCARTMSGVKVPYYRLSLWITLAYCINALAEAITVLHYLQHTSQVPLWVQSLFLLPYPCLLFAVWSLPGSPSPRSRRLLVFLDSLLLMTTIIAWSWYILVGPELLDGYFSPFKKALDLAYLSTDLILFLCMFRLFASLHNPNLRLVRYLLLIGIMMLIPAASINLLSHTQPASAQLWITISESVGYCLIAIAVQAVRFPEKERKILSAELDLAEPFSWWRTIFPYALVPTVLVLMLWLWLSGMQNPLAQGVYLAGLIVMMQIVARQVIVLREVLVANQRLRMIQDALRLKQDLLSQANEQLSTANERLGQKTEQLAAAYERQIEINEMKDHFMLHVSHELRTPLTTVHGYLSLLHEQQTQLDPALQAVFVAQALNGSEELYGMISGIQDALEIEDLAQPPQCEEILLLPVIYKALESFELETRQAYQLEVALPESLTLSANSKLLQQVFCNLLSNIFKYCLPETTIQIGAQAIEGREIHVWVQDTGPGIPPAEIPLLFDKFMRLKRDRTGSIRGAGLGLYICKRLIEAMQGRIWIESSGIAGEGSRVSLVLPAPPAAQNPR